MPIANFGEGLQKVVSFLPGTYGTALVRNHAMRGAFQQMVEEGVPREVVDSIKTSLDLYPKLLDKTVEIPQMYLILGGSVVVLMAISLILNMCKKKV